MCINWNNRLNRKILIVMMISLRPTVWKVRGESGRGEREMRGEGVYVGMKVRGEEGKWGQQLSHYP